MHDGGVRRRSLPWVAILLGWPPAAAAAEGGITVDVAEPGCPGRGQIVAALEARLPRVTAAGSTPGRRLELETGAEGPLLRLRAAGGAVELTRQLAPQARGPSAEGCEAIAEAAALVVVRYLREIGYQPPALEQPAPAPGP